MTAAVPSGLCRCYGTPPYSAAVIHGGPGAAGEMAPVATELSRTRGVLEPLQTKKTIEGQIKELDRCLMKRGNGPFTLVGFSWGAWLVWLTASRNPDLVKKLVLVGSGPFISRHAERILETRLNRLKEEERADVLLLSARMKKNEGISLRHRGDKTTRNRNLARLGELLTRADTFDSLPQDKNKYPPVEVDSVIFNAVWPEADEMRRSGRLLEAGKNIRCPVVAIHGDYDPHPAEGVEEPLSSILSDFRFILLPRCGHRPWIERFARDLFFQVLRKELPSQGSR